MRRPTDFAVGLTMLGGFLLVTGGVMWTKGSRIGGADVHASARFIDVGGARIGTPVVVRGVTAGEVDRMELQGRFVVVRLKLDPAIRLPDDPVVLLNESSLFGEWQATVTARNAVGRDDEVLRQLGEANLGGDILPGATLPDIAKLTAVAGRIAGDVAAVAERVDVAFDAAAARELRGSIRDFSALSTELAKVAHEQSRHLETTSKQVRGGVDQVAHAAELLLAVSQRIDSSTASGELGRLVNDANDAARQLRTATANLSTVSERLLRSQMKVDAFLASVDSIAVAVNSGRGTAGLLVRDSSLYVNSNAAIAELRALIADVRANPRRYISVKIF
jgi:phospholipid/cholesterol/gamma-HCH transport system substrate-binding protein